MNDTLRILIIDDFQLVRVMLRYALGDLGYQNVEEAEDGRVAIVKLRAAHADRKPYQLVFCDLNMPEVTGLEVLQTCRADEAFENLPFLMVTAESEQESVYNALRAGATDYIVKPISADMLKEKIKGAILKRKAM